MAMHVGSSALAPNFDLTSSATLAFFAQLNDRAKKSRLPSCNDREGWRAVSRTREFDLTPCFEEGIVLSTLLVVFVVAAIARLWFLRPLAKLQRTSGRSRWLLWAKLAFSVLAVLTSIACLALVSLPGYHASLYQSYILEVIALAFVPVLIYLSHTRTHTSSSLLLIFWPLYLASMLIWGRTYIMTHIEAFRHPHSPHARNPLAIFVLRCTVAFFGSLAFVLETLGPDSRKNLQADGGHSNPLISANIFSIWTFSWLTPLLRKGVKEYITEDDLPELVSGDESSRLGEKLERAMSKHKKLWVALFAAYGRPYGMAAILKIFQDCLAFLQPQLLRWLLSYMALYQQAHQHSFLAAALSPRRWWITTLPAALPGSGIGAVAFSGANATLTGGQDVDMAARVSSGPSALEGFVIALIMFVAAVTQTVLLHQYFQRCFETGMRVRAGLVNVIYKKALMLSSDYKRASGDIVNLMSVDATRLQDFCAYGLIAVSGPLQITLAFVSLYNLMGWSAFVGVGIMIVSLPLNTFIARILKKMQEEQMKNRDKRTRLMSEVLANIRSIKLYAWEHAFNRRVLQARNDAELVTLRKIGVVTALNASLWSGIPLLVAFSSFAVAAVTSDRPLTSDVIFPAISLFMLLQFPLAMFSQVVSNIVEAIVSINRLSEFFDADELQPDARLLQEKKVIRPGDEVLSISQGEFSWSKEATQPTLEGINLTVQKGHLVGVLGRVGAGKTSLLSAMIGDMRRTEGEVVVRGSIAYAPQNAWIMSATIRENILFSHVYDEDFYNMVLDACALRQDLELFAQGDLTEVGEKGITLSGGQRARISLARAVYARADIILLDDVLAALDSHVARHVFDNVIGPEGILASKARVLVTNGVAYLRHFDHLVYIRRGIVIEEGSYTSLAANTESEVSKLIRGHGSGSGPSSGSSTPRARSGTESPAAGDDGTTVAPSSDEGSPMEKPELLSEKLRRQSFAKAVLAHPQSARSGGDGLSKEHSEQGTVKRDVYRQYIKAASKLGFAMFILALILQQVLSLGANVTLSFWGGHNRSEGENASAGRYLIAYGMFSLTSTLFGAAAAVLLWVLCSIRSSRDLHDRMLHAVMRAPLSFFEQTPTGRILNLFSRDLYVVDQVLARVVSNLFRTLLMCIGIVGVIGFSLPPFLIGVLPLTWFYYRVMTYYLATSRELKRLDAVSKSPIFAWFSESLSGLSTIRAFTQQEVFIRKNQSRVDRNQMCYMPSVNVNRWLAVRLEFVGAIIIALTSVLALVAMVTTGVDSNTVGLILSYALSATGALNWVIRSASEVEQNIVSVERILHYCELTPEAPDEIEETKPSFEWPSKGEVSFSGYSLRYRPELDLVLKDISLATRPAEKIGICGRTGAGKSSLLLALFRVIEPASGTIFIDGVDITKQGLHDLRSAISIVPQSPDLFEGTIGENVDPTGSYSDEEIWRALGQSHLKEYVSGLPGGLDAPVSEGGSSLSAGQRQLLCFARALLRKTKILVLDEATSAVDLETDQAIQEIIRGPQFEDVTMFIIAHRLKTIMHSDRVLVLDAGKIAEFDTPSALLEKDTVFRSLAVESGLA